MELKGSESSRTPAQASARAGTSTLAIHSGALGDLVLFGRLCRALNGPVTLLAGRAKGDLLAGLDVVDRALDFDLLPMGDVFTADPPEQTGLSRMVGGHARLVSCFGGGTLAIQRRMGELTGATECHFLPICPPDRFAGHLLDLWAEQMGLADGPWRQETWTVPDAWRDGAANALAELGADDPSRCVLVHPGSGSARKNWPAERFVAMARRLVRDGWQVVTVIGPAEAECWPAERLESLTEGGLVWAQPALELLAGALASAACHVGNDSGPSHLAAAVGSPTVALFGPSRADHFAPVGPRVTVLTADRLAELDVMAVLEAVENVLAGR